MDIQVNLLKNGNEKAFKKIVESYWPRLYRFALTYVMDEEVAKEIVQDTFLTLWEQRKSLEEDTCLITYLMVINKNKCLNYLKLTKVETMPLSELSEVAVYHKSNLYVLEDESLEILITKELSAAIDASLAKLSPRTREIFIMSRYKGLKNKEIASLQNITVKTVEFHINKALKQLQYDLSKEYLVSFLICFYFFFTQK